MVSSGGNQTSKLIFRGNEDLGAGLRAGFWLEAGLSNDTGAAGSSSTTTGLFNRRSTVGLSGAFGEVRLGRGYKPTFWNNTVFDPFGTNGVGTNILQNVVGAATGVGPLGFESDNVRQSNTIGYFLPSNLGGLYGQFQYGFNEKTTYNDGFTPVNADTRSGG